MRQGNLTKRNMFTQGLDRFLEIIITTVISIIMRRFEIISKKSQRFIPETPRTCYNVKEGQGFGVQDTFYMCVRLR